MDQNIKINRIILLTKHSLSEHLLKIINTYCENAIQITFIENTDQLLIIQHELKNDDVLIAFSTSIIVPEVVIEKVIAAFNIHAASPQYPGRDPHHFAIYDDAKEYGATLHYMNKLVDAGKIIDIEMFKVPEMCTPTDLLSHANQAGISLFEKLIIKLFRDKNLPQPKNIKWNAKKTTRKDFLRMCNLTLDLNKEEVMRRIRAFHIKGRKNLNIKFHGNLFYYDES